jgi:hypothetical protein
MALIVEDGTGLANADAYVSAANCLAYSVANGSSFPPFVLTDPVAADAAIRRATTFIDSYRARFPGFRLKRRLQALEWPRSGAFTYLPSTGREYPYLDGRSDILRLSQLGYSYIGSNEIPTEIVKATCEAAIRELATPLSMSPDLERGGYVKSLKAGSVEIVYQDGADPNSTTQLIDGILSGLLLSDGGGMFGTAARG